MVASVTIPIGLGITLSPGAAVPFLLTASPALATGGWLEFTHGLHTVDEVTQDLANEILEAMLQETMWQFEELLRLIDALVPDDPC